MPLIISDRVIRSHHCVYLSVSVPSKEGHRHFDREALHDLGLRHARCLHPAVAVAVLACPLHDAVDPLLLDLIVERRILLPSHLTVEALLHITADVLLHSLLSISLHLRIYRGIYPEAVPVYVVLRSVRLSVLVDPSVEFVIGPKERIHYIVLILVIR